MLAPSGSQNTAATLSKIDSTAKHYEQSCVDFGTKGGSVRPKAYYDLINSKAQHGSASAGIRCV